MVINDEDVRIWKEVKLMYFLVLFWSSSGKTEGIKI
jgi:hypothetical protein